MPPVNNTPQPDLGSPLAGAAPQGYLSPDAAKIALNERWGIDATLNVGNLLVASMSVDQQAPFLGVKLDPMQDRQWPRTFKYGWPNIIAAPSPMMVAMSYPGAWLLDYEGVVPQQVLDWVALEAYRMVTLPFDRAITAETISGASVHYAVAPNGTDKSAPSELDRIQELLITPFQLREGHTAAFPNLGRIQ